ncbi:MULTISPECIES: hypothetical protein [Mucilaginibacter]|uniref:hypothetical protein n=1 Tax=Mucilaginibacter TaxID=423349 RepID=UPI0020910754|nr:MULTISPECIES: hypothetical protein [Mucilaginibacter]MEB0249627.1 hypothetical protein [Mucilaginibacter sp. 5B2]MCO5936265.1 hypothetical protein [Mucilaginibacter aurantiaciroseus]MEB0261432.1 hypothetical protein [Mucilaginibacter sp. 10I4]MEB0276982.1 hypothetical protein [Mucilaginibacter sp. 10B2]MEB0301495.1 hypothetical protein [Mucilaginibacter sp. 5C4]
MKNAINTILTDINHVFVKGESDKVEQARVFFLLAVPIMSIIFGIGEFPIY